MEKLLRAVLLLAHEPVHHLDGQGEDDGGVLLGADAVQGLQIPATKKKKIQSCISLD